MTMLVLTDAGIAVANGASYEQVAASPQAAAPPPPAQRRLSDLIAP